MKPIPLFGSGMKSFSSSITAQRRLNCFFDIRKDDDKTQIAIRATPAPVAAILLNDAPIRGWRVVGSFMYVVAGSSVFQVASDNTSTLLGTISNSGQYCTLSDNSLQLIIVDGQLGYTVTLPSGAPTIITDSRFPNGCTTVAQLDSRFIAENPGTTRQFQVGALLDGALWTPYIFGTKENSSDPLIAVDVLNGAVVLWGTTNIEFWQNTGGSPNPYQRINGASQTWGLAAKYSRSALNNTMIFLAQNPQGGIQVMMFNGYNPVRVSNSDVENIISNFTIYSDAVALTYMIDGHPMYQLTFPAANRSFLFDASTELWYEVQSGVENNARHFANLGIVFNAKNYVSDATSGIIYQLTPNLFTDNGAAVKRMVTSRHIRMGGNEFGISEAILEMDTGVGLVSGQGTDPQIMMRISRDGGKTWGPERWKKMGRRGQYLRRLVWDRCGSGRDFVFQWTLTDPVPFTITLGEAVLSPGEEANQ